MSRTFHQGGNQDRQIRADGLRKQHPDYRRLGRALLALLEAEAESEAQMEHQQRQVDDSEIPKNKRKHDANEHQAGDAA